MGHNGASPGRGFMQVLYLIWLQRLYADCCKNSGASGGVESAGICDPENVCGCVWMNASASAMSGHRYALAVMRYSESRLLEVMVGGEMFVMSWM